MTDTPATSPITPTTDAIVAQGALLATLAVTIRGGLLDVADGTMSNDRCAEIHDARLAIKRMVKELDAEAEDAFVTRLKAHGDIDLGGGRRLYAAPSTTVRSKDNLATLNIIMAASCGDLDATIACLSSRPFKHGAVQSLLATVCGVKQGFDMYNSVFETIVTSKTKEGKAKDRVQIADEQYKG